MTEKELEQWSEESKKDFSVGYEYGKQNDGYFSTRPMYWICPNCKYKVKNAEYEE